MSDLNTNGLIAFMQSTIGGAATALVAAIAGRLMWHAGEVRKKRRPMVSLALIAEVPVAIGMAIAGDSFGEYFGLTDGVRVGVIAVFSYLGPRGIEAAIDKWVSRNKAGE